MPESARLFRVKKLFKIISALQISMRRSNVVKD
jgi:hypothetical protein